MSNSIDLMKVIQLLQLLMLQQIKIALFISRIAIKTF